MCRRPRYVRPRKPISPDEGMTRARSTRIRTIPPRRVRCKASGGSARRWRRRPPAGLVMPGARPDPGAAASLRRQQIDTPDAPRIDALGHLQTDTPGDPGRPGFDRGAVRCRGLASATATAALYSPSPWRCMTICHMAGRAELAVLLSKRSVLAMRPTARNPSPRCARRWPRGRVHTWSARAGSAGAGSVGAGSVGAGFAGPGVP